MLTGTAQGFEGMNILIVKLSAIGDVVQALPAVEAIGRARPGASIDWVVEEAAADILDGHPSLRRVIVSRRKSWLKMLKHPATFAAGVRGVRGFLQDLRSTRYDIAVDLQGLLKSGIVIGASRCRMTSRSRPTGRVQRADRSVAPRCRATSR